MASRAAKQEGEEGEEGTQANRGVQEVKWSVPEGFVVADEPTALSDPMCTCVGKRMCAYFARISRL